MKKYKGLLAFFTLLFCVIFVSKAYGADKAYYYGDANADGTVTADDALTILKSVVNLNTINSQLCKNLADINGDGSITSEDALKTLKIVVGLENHIEYRAISFGQKTH